MFIQKCRCQYPEVRQMPQPDLTALRDDIGTLPLADDFLPAVMQALHYYTEMMQYEQVKNPMMDETTRRPVTTTTRRSTTTTTTTRRTTTTTTPRFDFCYCRCLTLKFHFYSGLQLLGELQLERQLNHLQQPPPREDQR
jgi:hypothetical protein